MSLHVLASGVLIADPQQRQGQKGSFTTAMIRAGSGDEQTLVSIIAFQGLAERLLELKAGDGVSVAGRARLTSWTAKDGTEKHGLSVVASEIAAARPPAKPASGRRHSGPRHEQRPAGNGERPFNDEIPF
jgi:single-stranded DNA-binding protein